MPILLLELLETARPLVGGGSKADEGGGATEGLFGNEEADDSVGGLSGNTKTSTPPGKHVSDVLVGDCVGKELEENSACEGVMVSTA